MIVKIKPQLKNNNEINNNEIKNNEINNNEINNNEINKEAATLNTKNPFQSCIRGSAFH
jgi:hypothetical protein